MCGVCGLGNIIILYAAFAGDRLLKHLFKFYYFSDVSRENNNNANYNTLYG